MPEPVPPMPPPRTLNVKNFADARSRELESLHAVVSDRLNHNFKIHRSKRRRTTGYRSSKHKIRKATTALGSDSNPKTSRRVRRRLELKFNPDTGFVRAGDGTRRLRTHLWHAKRFTMVKRWGYYLPLGIQGRGRGSRAVLKWLRFGALVHDASYCTPIQLEGPKDSILAVLRMVLLPFPSSSSEEISHLVHHGVRYNNSMLYHDVSDVGPQLSQFIAPVFYMWRPILNLNKDVTAEEDHVSKGGPAFVKQECSTSYRQMWIWIHAAAFEEGFSALKVVCQKQYHESGGFVNCFSLEGRMAKLEVMGTRATQILQKILHPISEMRGRSDHHPSTCTYLKACTASQVQKPSVLHNDEYIPSHAILSLRVHDPRDVPSKETEVDIETTRPESDFQENDILSSNPLISGTSVESEDSLFALWSMPETNRVFLSDSRDLWDSNEKMKPPLPENILCTDRHRKRLKHFNLVHIDDEKLISGARDGFDQSCPVVLLKNANSGRLNAGWSIILPLSWVKVFWMSLVSHGAHAIGLRERRWIACDSGLPCFPYDFPDCKAYTSLMASEAIAFDESAELRPPAVRPSRVPIPPPWECIEPNCKQELETNGTSLVSVSETPGTSSLDQSDVPFHGFIPRYSYALNEYLKKIWDVSIDHMPSERGLCLVRVLVRAFKEGFFEDGAIVCAPILTDLPRWDSSRSEEESLQIPHSMIKSYFVQRDSGKWVLQLPENSSTPESYRWPIGFVTTGFIRGSKKPMAVAFCEVKLLVQLREMQKQQPGLAMQNEARHEICVLVRNMRSASYRCAYASIALEIKEEDTWFL